MTATFTLISVIGASPAAADDSAGLGGLIVGPDLRHGGQATLYERFGSDSYFLDDDLGLSDLPAKAVNYLLNFLLSLLVVFVRGCITLTEWVFNLNLWPDLRGGTGQAVTSLADSVFWPLLPVVLAIGAIAAWAAHKRDRTGVTDFTWLVAAAIVGISFVTQPAEYLTSLDEARMAVSTEVMTGLAGGVVDSPEGPLPYPVLPADSPGTDPKDVALRRAADSIWRTYVVTPWCVGEFGSLSACQKYGLVLLAFGNDTERRRAFISLGIGAQDGGDPETAQWLAGKHVAGRAGVVLLALLTAIPFALLLLFLGLAALIAAFTVIALGVLGPLFLLCWPIRGRARQIGARWIEALVGAVLQGVAVTAVLGVTLVMSSLIVRLSDKYGYALTALLNIAATVTAFRYRRMLETILGTAMPGAASPLVGLAALWGARKLSRKVLGGWRIPRPSGPRPRTGPTGPGSGHGPARTFPDRLRPLPPGSAGDRSPTGPRTPRPVLPGKADLPTPTPVVVRTGRPSALAAPEPGGGTPTTAQPVTASVRLA
ncbi:MAG TPA: hypothetical protein VIS06_20950, partial [Mycobacteriales bacterium]